MLICPWQRGWILAHYAVDPSTKENASLVLFVGLLVLDEWTEITLSAENGYVGGTCVSVSRQ